MQLTIDTNLAHEYIQHCINNINICLEQIGYKLIDIAALKALAEM